MILVTVSHQRKAVATSAPPEAEGLALAKQPAPANEFLDDTNATSVTEPAVIVREAVAGIKAQLLEMQAVGQWR